MRARFLVHCAVLAACLWAVSLTLPWILGSGADALAQEVRKPQGVAVIVGNKVYAHRDVPEVSFAHRDADAFRHYVVDVLGYDPENIIDLRDASQAEMEAAFGNERSHEGRLWRYLNPDGGSDVVVFYSGHGVPGLNDRRGYLLPVDGNPNTAEINGYPIDLLYENLGKLAEARSVQVFLDACFSGDSHDGMLVRAASPVNMSVSLPTGLGGNVTWLTAASGAQVASWDEEAGHGLFTHHLLDALYGAGDADEDGRVTAQEAKAYLDRHMTRAARRTFGRNQHADLKEAGETVLASASPDGAFPQRPDLDKNETADDEDTRDPGLVKLVDGLTLLRGDWIAMAQNQLETGDHGAHEVLLQEASRYLRAHGRDAADVVEIEDRAASSLAATIEFATKEEALEALTRIEKIEAEVGDQPALLRVRARAHRLLGDAPSELASYDRWLKAAPESHPERGEVLSVLIQIRADLSQFKRFSELLGRPFSVDVREESVGWTDLHYAALLDMPAVVKALINGGMAADVRLNRLKTDFAPFGDAPKQTLIRLGYEEFTRRLAAGETPLLIAARANAHEAVKALIAAGADVKATTPGTALHFAAYHDALETVELLVNQGAGIHARDVFGGTPLHEAARENALETAKWLIARGADVKAQNHSHKTPLHLAAKEGALETAKLLVTNGANIHAGGTIDETPLHKAAESNALETVKWLVAQGAYIDSPTEYGYTPLHLATKWEAWETAEWLIAQGANVKATLDGAHSTPLHFAAAGNARGTAALLLDRGAIIDAKDDDGYTPLHIAAYHDALETVVLLLNRGAEFGAESNLGKSILHRAAQGNALATAKLLVEEGADIAATDIYENTPLHEAAWENARDMAEWLVAQGANIATPDKTGHTPLHEAAWMNAHETAEWLVEHGADVNAIGDKGETPLQFAIVQGHAETENALRRLGGRTAQEEREVREKRARTKLLEEQGTRHLKRPFSADAVEESVGWTDLHYAALLNLPGAVNALIEEGAGADVRLKTGARPFGASLKQSLAGLEHEETFKNWDVASAETPLMIAAVANASEVAQALIARGANSHAKNDYGETPLHYAAWGNAPSTATTLLERGVVIDARDKDGNTPLHEAARHNAREVAEWLVAHGADLNATNDDGETPSDRGTAQHHTEMQKLFLRLGRRTAQEEREVREEAKAKLLVDLGTKYLDRPFSADALKASVGWTDLHFAALLDLPAVVHALVDNGVAVDVRLKTGDLPFGYALERTFKTLGFENLGIGGSAGDTPLMIAALANAVGAAEALTARGADIDAASALGLEPLHYAAFTNAREVAQWLLAQGADVMAIDQHGATPLHKAALGNSRETAELVLARGADIETKNIDGNTPLHRAAWSNARVVAEILLAQGAEIAAKNNGGDTPLHLAAWRDARETTELLVTLGADIRGRDNGGNTPLHEAAWTNALKTVRWLIAQGAEIAAKNNGGDTPLHFAAYRDARETTELLVTLGADIRGRDNEGSTPLHEAAWTNALKTVKWLIAQGAEIAAKNNGGDTPLHFAAYRDARETTELLVTLGADIRGRDNAGNTPLHEAAWTNALKTVKWLIAQGAEIAAKNNGGDTPLHRAAHGDAMETVRWLVAQGADIMARNKNRATPLHKAARGNARATAELLVASGANIMARNKDRATPLHEAARGNARATAETLVASGADIMARDKHRETPLHKAAMEKAEETAKFLVASGADVATPDKYGNTPLHEAAWANSLVTAKLLLERGASVMTPDGDGDTPLHLAARFNALEMAEWLVEHDAAINATDDAGTTPLDEAMTTHQGDAESRAATQALLRRLGGKTGQELR